MLQTIPAQLQGVLWSRDIAKLDLKKDKIYIIHQIFSHGRMEDFRWLLQTYPKAELKKIFIQHPYKDYAPARFSFRQKFSSRSEKNLWRKKRMSRIHLEILDKERQEVFHALAQFKTFGYLGGGTALSLQIQHRRSFDFDVFVSKPITTLLRAKVKEIFGETKYYVDSKDQISFVTKNNINVTFLWYYFDRLFPLISTDSLSLASIQDIAADKAHTIGRRAVWRDYIDFFFLLKDKWLTLDDVIHFAKKKFGGEFNETLFLQQLSYFRDIDATGIEFIDSAYESIHIKHFLEKQVESYLSLLE